MRDTLRAARLRDRAGAPTDETPMLLEELLDEAPPELALQVEIKAYGDPALTRAFQRLVEPRDRRPRVRCTARTSHRLLLKRGEHLVEPCCGGVRLQHVHDRRVGDGRAPACDSSADSCASRAAGVGNLLASRSRYRLRSGWPWVWSLLSRRNVPAPSAAAGIRRPP